MTLVTPASRVDYTGDGVSTAFAIPFPFWGTAELQVALIGSDQSVTLLTPSGGYIATGGNGIGGYVTLVGALQPGTRLVIRRMTNRTQLADYVANDDLDSATLERSLDRLAAIAAEITEADTHTLRLPFGETAPGELPDKLTRASCLLGFGADGSPSALPIGGFLPVFPTIAPGGIVLDPRTYGAKGDGVADDTAAIQAAIDAASGQAGGTVFLRAGTYLVSATLRGRPFVSLRGELANRTVISRTGDYGDTLVYGSASTGAAGSFSVENLWFSHGTLQTTVTGAALDHPISQPSAHLRLYGCQNAWVRNCFFWRMPYCIALHGAILPRIEGNWFYQTWDPATPGCQEGIASVWLATSTLGQSQIVSITKNYFTGSLSNTRSITWSDGISAGVTVNQLQPCGSKAGVQVDTVEGLEISDNYFGAHSQFNIALTSQVAPPPATTITANVRIKGNYFDGCGGPGASASIYVAKANGANYALGVAIANNTFNCELNTLNAILFGPGYTPGDFVATNVSITGNNIFATIASAIVAQGLRGALISGNTATNYNCLGAAVAGGSQTFTAGIFVGNNSAYVHVIGNAVGGGGNDITNGSAHCLFGIVLGGVNVGTLLQADNANLGTGSFGAQQLATGLVPVVDNSVPLGSSVLRFSAVYAANGTIQTSDPRDKTDVQELPDCLPLIQALEPRSFRWKVGGREQRDDGSSVDRPGRRTHWGFMADNVRDAMAGSGRDFAGYVRSEEGVEMLRPDQLIPVLVKALQELAGPRRLPQLGDTA